MTDTFTHLELAIIRQPAVVSLDTPWLAAMVQMIGTTDLADKNLADRSVTNDSAPPDNAGSSYLVIVDDGQVVGLLTERDVVRLAVKQLPLETLTLREVWERISKKPPVTIRESALTDTAVVLSLFEKHQLSHMPILDETAQLVGVISREMTRSKEAYGQWAVEYDEAGPEIAAGGIAADISDQKRAESLLEDQYKILEKIAKAEPLQDIFQSFLTAMETYLPDTACSIILCQEGHLCHPFAPSLPKAYVEAINASVVPIAEGIGSCGTAAYRQEMVISADIATDSLWQNFKHLVMPYGLKSCWSMPVLGKDQTVLGVFGIYAQKKRSPQASEIEFVSQLVNLAGIAIEREQSTQALKQLNQKLENRVAERTAELQASEERWQLALKGSNDGIWDWNPQTNQLFLSQRLKEIRGFDETTLPTSWDNYVKLIHPEDRDNICQAIEAHLAGKSEFFEVEYRAKHQHGAYIWVLSRAQAQRDALGHAVRMIGSETDITHRKTAEQALILKQNHLEALLNNIPHIAWIKDAQSRLITVNQPFAQVCNTVPETIVGKTDLDLFPAELAQAYRDDDAHVLQSGQRKVVEERVARSDGTLGWLETIKTPFRDANGQLAGTVGIAADITDRKIAELALKESQEKLRRLTDNIPGMVFRYVLHPDNTNEFTYVSPYSRELLELDSEAIIRHEQNPWERVHPDDVDGLKAKLQQSEQRGQPSTVEHRLRLPIGGLRWAQTISRPERQQNGDIVWDGITFDITDRKTAELALQASEAKFQRITESVPGVIYRYVLHPNGQDEFTYISPQVRQLYELEPEAVLKNSQLMWESVHPNDVPRLSEAIQVSTAALQPFYIEMRLRLPQERIKWVQVMSHPEQHNNGDISWDGVILEISDCKQAEEALAILSERLKLALDSAEIGIWEWCSDTNTLIWDDRMFSLYGIAPEDFSGQYEDWLQRLHAEDVTQTKIKEEVALRERASVTTEFRIVRPDGEVRFIYSTLSKLQTEQGGRVRTIGLDIDITERKQAEMALEKEVLRRAAVFNASPDGIHILDRAGNLLEANASFAEMLGYRLDEVSQLNVADWDAQWSEEELQDIFQNYPADTRATLETLHRRKNGSVFPVEITECSMEWNGEFALVCISRDISERKQAEAKLKLTNQELARATRLKDEFLANMSHELRTPLNAILGMTEGLQDEVFGQINTNQIKALTTIEQSGSHLLELINEILDLAKIEADNIDLTYAVVSVTHLCQSSLTFIKQQSLEKGIQLHLRMPWDLPPIRVNERRIRQVLINLLSNAVKFTPAGGNVTLKVELIPSHETHCGPCLRLGVTDTGIGINPEGLNQLFQPFFQIDSALNRQYEGTGLGLALVKRIVEIHGGRVTVTSTAGVGSCFAIELPYDNAALNTLEPGATSAPSGVIDTVTQPTKSPLILITEDNEANLATLSSYLAAKGYRIEVATDGKSAIELAQEKPPHIILMDIQMPGMDGLTAIQHIRQHPDLKRTPIIALTALAMEGDQARCLAAGADKYLSKPVKLKQLALSIQGLLA